MRKQRQRIQSTCSRSPTGKAHIWTQVLLSVGFPGDTDGKESPRNAVYWNSIPGSGRSPGGGHGTSLHYSCLENPKNRGAWRATVHGLTKSQSQLKRLSLPTLLSEDHAFNSCAISLVQILACSTWEGWSHVELHENCSFLIPCASFEREKERNLMVVPGCPRLPSGLYLCVSVC